jgi:hypothetical protein
MNSGFILLVEDKLVFVAQTKLELTSLLPQSWSVGIAGTHHCVQLRMRLLKPVAMTFFQGLLAFKMKAVNL